MKIKALKSNFGDNGHIRRGQIIDVLDEHAQQLIRRGIFTDVLSEADSSSVTATHAADIDLAKLKKDELSAHAFQHAVAIDDSDTKAQIIAKIRKAQAVKKTIDELSSLDDDQILGLAADEGLVLEADDDKAAIIDKIANARAEK